MADPFARVAGSGEAASPEPSGPPANLPGYELIDEIGHGGMGVVYRARDAALDRDVAVKLLSERYPPDSVPAERFVSEARITGQLQHPGIPAVHQVGALADGRPFLAMKLIKGSTLETILKQRTNPSADRGRLLAIFEAVCQAVGYAHAHRVIHRDLKPANVMVGAFGEVQVMDWGLAKALGEKMLATEDAQAAEQTRAWTEVSPTPETGSHTHAGSMVGTPAFIPPEQAIGQIDQVNERSDVFGLGALLAVILTGKPPYVGETFESVRVQAVRGRLEGCFAGLDACGAEPELVALCKQCLAFEPGDRPADAGAVAQAVAGLRAAADERARRAELERVRVEGEQATAAARSAAQARVARLFKRFASGLAVALCLAVALTIWAFLLRVEARRQGRVAQQEADKATKAREFLVSIFQKAETDEKGGNVTVRQLLQEAETRIPVEFADQPELREDLVAAIGNVKRGIARRSPQAMILELRGTVTLHSHQGEAKRVLPHGLVNLDDRLTLSPDAQVLLVFLADFHKERLNPGREVTIDFKGCVPADAVRERDDSLLMTFVRLPRATFYMGGGGGKRGIKTEITESFEIAAHTVTQGQWEALMGYNPSWFSRTGNGRDNIRHISDEELRLFPVEMVSWENAQAFIKKLNDIERGKGWLYRLPTEAEWEYACRAGATSAEECSYHFYLDKPTNALSSDYANFNGLFPFGNAPIETFLGRPSRVGAYPANQLGLYDMHGNVWQWCADLASIGGSNRVIRGSNHVDEGAACQAALRRSDAPQDRDGRRGFRLVRLPVR